MNTSGFRITLEAARVNRSMTQEDVANALGVTRCSIINWERGKTVIPADRLMELLALYETPMEYIILPKHSTKSR